MPASPKNPFHQHRGVKKLREVSYQKIAMWGALFFLAVFILLNCLVVLKLHVPSADGSDVIKDVGGGHPSVTNTAARKALQQSSSSATTNDGNNKDVQCHFRQYPPRRYYGLQKLEQPDFLTAVEYVYGKYPIMVTPSLLPQKQDDYRNQGKLCVDQSEWLPADKNDRTKELPFADGTNPSILTLERLEKDESHEYAGMVQELQQMGGAFVATICMTDSQCAYQDTPQEVQQFKLSKDTKATVVQTLLLILDDKFQTLLQTTIWLERDAPWGRKFKRPARNPDGKTFERVPMAMDDARLFIHLDKVWVSFREGRGFGYEQQVLNEIHLDLVEDNNDNNPQPKKKLMATIKASETASFCCGRNMALMEHLDDPTQLQSLTWADPVTVIDVDDKRKGKSDTSTTGNNAQPAQPRRLQEETKKKSHFHGTNAFMVYLPKSDEFLGIGHFHRPPGRDAFNPYARFGHHYTHTFFTISSKPPFRLTRLSQEFVLPSKSNILQDEDAEIIQFLSGLEVITNNNKDYAVIAYGINDCEGAAVYLEMDRVNQLLQPVEVGKEVVDLMQPLEKRS